jgi:hypothetical protein
MHANGSESAHIEVFTHDHMWNVDRACMLMHGREHLSVLTEASLTGGVYGIMHACTHAYIHAHAWKRGCSQREDHLQAKCVIMHTCSCMNASVLTYKHHSLVGSCMHACIHTYMRMHRSECASLKGGIASLGSGLGITQKWYGSTRKWSGITRKWTRITRKWYGIARK